MKIFLQITVYMIACFFWSCNQTNSTPSVASNSVHSKATRTSNYEKNQRGIVLADQDKINPLNNLRSKIKNNATYYIDKTSPKFSNKECFYPFIKKENNHYEVFLRVRHVAEEWIETENILITVDNKDFPFKGEVVRRETKGKKVYKIELLEISLNEHLDMLTEIAKGKEVLGVIIGKSKYKKHIMSEEQKLVFQNIFDAYSFLTK